MSLLGQPSPSFLSLHIPTLLSSMTYQDSAPANPSPRGHNQSKRRQRNCDDVLLVHRPERLVNPVAFACKQGGEFLCVYGEGRRVGTGRRSLMKE